jgi:adenosylcobinamide-phosphate synthase
MRDASLAVLTPLKKNDIHEARRYLSRIVRRDTSDLDQELVLSATVESIAESTVDGITSPLFYFTLFGVPGAMAFRVINTLDSIVGYKDHKHANIGWFSAKLDSVLNFIPARVTAGLMVLGAWLTGENGKSSWRVLKRDRSKTESTNAGYPMSAMAGALGVRLEKPGHYELGNNDETIRPSHIPKALRIMEMTVGLFLIFVIAPMLMVRAVD